MKKHPTYTTPRVKVFSAIFSALSVTLFLEIYNYVPVAERREDVYYYPFGYEFSLGFIINLSIFLILLMPLSIVVDGLILSKFNIQSVKRSVVFILSYCMLGVIGGVIYSIFIRNIRTLSDYIIYLLIGSITFLIYQFFFNRIFYRAYRKK